MSHRLGAAGVLAVVLALLLLPGCGRSDIGRVEGTVTMDGEPLPDAVVTFQPDEGRPSFGRTDASGQYVLHYTGDVEGAALGQHTVSISTLASGDEDQDQEGAAETVPSQYNSETKLKATVEAGTNTLDFQLESSGRIKVHRESEG